MCLLVVMPLALSLRKLTCPITYYRAKAEKVIEGNERKTFEADVGSGSSSSCRANPFLCMLCFSCLNSFLYNHDVVSVLHNVEINSETEVAEQVGQDCGNSQSVPNGACIAWKKSSSGQRPVSAFYDHLAAHSQSSGCSSRRWPLEKCFRNKFWRWIGKCPTYPPIQVHH